MNVGWMVESAFEMGMVLICVFDDWRGECYGYYYGVDYCGGCGAVGYEVWRLFEVWDWGCELICGTGVRRFCIGLRVIWLRSV